MTGVTALSITAAPELSRVATRLRKMPAHELAYAACRLIGELEGAHSLFREMRADAIREMRALGLTATEIGDLIDVAPEQVYRWEAAAGH